MRVYMGIGHYDSDYNASAINIVNRSIPQRL